MPDVIVLCSFRGFHDRDDRIADMDRAEAPQRQRMKLAGRSALDLEHSDVGRLVGAEHLGVEESPFEKATFTEEAPRTTWALV
jgi:hypothetical protein